MELQQLIDQLQQLSTQEDLTGLGREASQLKLTFEDQLLELERQEQVKRLDAEAAGTSYEEIEYNELRLAFQETYASFVEKRKAQVQLQTALENENLKQKKQLIARLKEVIDNEEKIGTAFQSYKEIHETWKKIGAIPRDQREAIQKEYSRLLEIFFYNIKIYKELQEHDYRRNKQLKESLIFKLKQLRASTATLRDLEAGLNALQDEWEEIGPVLNEEWEALRSAYWEAVRGIYDKINVFYEEQRQTLKANIDAKKALVQALAEKLENLPSWTSIKQWEEPTKFILDLQEKWKKIGFGSRKENEAIYQEFRAHCDRFFEAKKQVSKSLEANFTAVAAQKKTLIEKAQQLSQSTNWKETADQLKRLQQQWQQLGNAGHKWENKLWKEFRAACNAFFDAKDQHFTAQDATFEGNLALKNSLIEELKSFETTDDKQATLSFLRDIQKRYTDAGPVPSKARQTNYTAFKALMDEKYAALKLEGAEKERILFQAKLESIVASPDKAKQLQAERADIRRQIDGLQKEMLTLENNLGFFARSKGADQLRAEVTKKIQQAQERISALKAKLKLIPNE
ncbi:MAG: hypothetical protein RLZZ301_795 [Bacteroidota bacterium]|jgi:hypothetical protein